MKLIASILLLIAPAATLAAEPANLDKLAVAVAVAETSNCTTGMALTKNNCHGIMTWASGRRTGRWFATRAESFAAFKSLWTRLYGGRFPTMADAKRYTGNDRAATWLGIVTAVYHR